ncbi:MAG TPA: toxic anion resistance protein, partial [Allosphingosinicella sp.]
IDRFKVEALGNMKQTVNVLTSEVEKSRGYIARAEGVEQNRLSGDRSPLTALEG